MNQKRRRRKKKTRILLILCASMVAAAVLFFGAWQYLAHLLDAQQAAQRWEGDGDLDFSQITCFLPADQKIGLKDITTFRTAAVKVMEDAALDVTENRHLMVDGWSTTAKLYTSGEHGRGEASVIAVGGDYFDFHPLRLLSGDYIRQSDLMKDRIVLSEEVAWLLFGGTDLAGMTMKLNGTPYIIAGVVEQEKDIFDKKSNSDGLDLYMSYDALLAIDENAKINCYELVMANPVKGFAMKAVKDKFPIGRGEILCNSERYGYGKLMDLLRLWKADGPCAAFRLTGQPDQRRGAPVLGERRQNDRRLGSAFLPPGNRSAAHPARGADHRRAPERPAGEEEAGRRHPARPVREDPGSHPQAAAQALGAQTRRARTVDS